MDSARASASSQVSTRLLWVVIALQGICLVLAFVRGPLYGAPISAGVLLAMLAQFQGQRATLRWTLAAVGLVSTVLGAVWMFVSWR